MRERQSRYIVHAYDTLETGELDSIIHFGLFKLFGNVGGLSEVNRRIILALLRFGVAKQGVVIVIYDLPVRVGTRRHDPLALAGVRGAY